jgi:hypothetical protein
MQLINSPENYNSSFGEGYREGFYLFSDNTLSDRTKKSFFYSAEINPGHIVLYGPFVSRIESGIDSEYWVIIAQMVASKADLWLLEISKVGVFEESTVYFKRISCSL